jgi:hypothetical protein
MGQARTDQSWHGIRQSVRGGRADPDGAEISVRLPVAWGQDAADALAGLLPGQSSIDLTTAASAWIEPIAAEAKSLNMSDSMGRELHERLAARYGAAPGRRHRVSSSMSANSCPMTAVLTLPVSARPCSWRSPP